jgi:AcrR family transcriptional regulator
MAAEARAAQLTEAAYKIAKKSGIRKVTRAAVAREVQVSDGLLNRYFGSRDGLRFAVLEYAVMHKDAKTLAAASEHYELPNMPRSLAAEVKRLSH